MPLSLLFTIAGIAGLPPAHAQTASSVLQAPGESGGVIAATAPSSVLDRIRAKMREEESPQNQAQRWFDNLDLDGNGEITKQELFEGLRRRFEDLDENRDRFISRTEYVRARKDRATGQRRFGELDVNNDGRISIEEFASPADWRFDRIDRNLDGKISMTEAQRLFDRPVGAEAPRQSGDCFYVDRQVVMVNEETAELYRNRGYPKADCQWTPDTTGQNKAKLMVR